MKNTATGKKGRKSGGFGEVMRRMRKNKSAMIGLVIFLLEVFIAIIAPFIMPCDPYRQDYDHILERPSKEHWFGTDDLGRDVFSRILLGSRYSLGLGLSVVLFALVIGTVIGSIVGYWGGWIDTVFMRILEVFECIPPLLTSVAIAVALGNGFMNTLLALSLSRISSIVRLLRGSIMNIRHVEYLEAADAVNSSKLRTIVTHVLPNSFSPLIVNSTMGIASSIMTAATLSFVGLGILPPSPEWGAMLSGSRNYIRDYPYLVIIPGIAIAITVLALNLMGDGLRDALDPKLKD